MNNFSIDRFGKLVRWSLTMDLVADDGPPLVRKEHVELAGGVYADVSVLYLCGEV